MEARELRIGNWISALIPDERSMMPCQIEATAGMIYDLNSQKHISESTIIGPIILKEHWLKKFGFEEKPLVFWNGNGYDWTPYDNRTEQRDFVLGEFIVRFEKWGFIPSGEKDFHFEYNQYILMSEWSERVTENAVYAKIDYIHQLQNLYFALTGEELTIKK